MSARLRKNVPSAPMTSVRMDGHSRVKPLAAFAHSAKAISKTVAIAS
jgi:hypothetical protein